jgi:hypothetical protein
VITRVVGVHPDGRSKTIEIPLEPKIRPDDLLFAEYRRDDTHVDAKPHSLYEWHCTKLNELLDGIGKGQRIASSQRAPRRFTFYRLRDFVKTTISDLGFSDYAEWLIGHSHSTYYQQTKQKQIEMFRKVEPYLTFLDVTGLEARTADIESKVNQKDKMISDLQRRLEKVEVEVLRPKIQGAVLDVLEKFGPMSIEELLVNINSAIKRHNEQSIL